MEKLQFRHLRKITPDNIEALPTHQKEQFFQAGEMVYGKKLSITDIFRNTYENEASLWEVGKETELNITLYDVWVFDVDSACVFLTGTAQDARVCMTQFSFCPTDEETDELHALSDALQEAFDKL